MTDLLSSMSGALPLGAYCGLVNLSRALRGHGYRLHPAGEDGIYRITDADGAVIHLCRRGRHRRYKRGVAGGVASLAGRYNLTGLAIRPGGVFVDCGANVGELGVWARAQGMAYVAYEPEELEARTCDLNNFDGRPETRRKALWHETKELTFYRKPETADSSLIEIDGSHAPVTVQAVALADDLPRPAGDGTSIFKLEAEGAEPEVLTGAEPVLDAFDYVTVDAGFERGRAKEATFVPVVDFLTARGFRLVAVNFDFLTATFARRDGAA
ncbi:FkbM family methyltransferase [Rhodobacterales bacterium HKCCE2091]|nr:FkbM family methyltransferase [Rhodobacterales bacterium HKCCE2091]